MFNKILFDRSKFNTTSTGKYLLLGGGGIIINPVIYTPMPPIFGSTSGIHIIPLWAIPIYPVLESEGGLSVPDFTLVLNLNIRMGGSSDLELLNIGDTTVSLIYLKDIELDPGESIVIDTDLMVVLINGVHDVSSMTTNSKFFMLGVGENEFTFEYTVDPEVIDPDPPDDKLDIAVIYQNRWL